MDLFAFIALKEFSTTYTPNFDGITCSLDKPEALGSACAEGCRSELLKVLGGCNLWDPHNVISVMTREVFRRVFRPDPTDSREEVLVTPVNNMKNFVVSLVESNHGLDAKTKSMFGCFGEKLFQYYERDTSLHKEQGIKDMTDKTIELLRVIDKKRTYMAIDFYKTIHITNNRRKRNYSK